MLTHAVPIESQFKSLLPDNLNAELVLGSVSNVKEAVAWLTYTYLHVRMTKNPLVYGISYEQLLVRGGAGAAAAAAADVDT
jgi:activating signal cointegrator complex subunit 3